MQDGDGGRPCPILMAAKTALVVLVDQLLDIFKGARCFKSISPYWGFNHKGSMSNQYPPALTMAGQVPIFTSLQQGQKAPSSSQMKPLLSLIILRTLSYSPTHLTTGQCKEREMGVNTHLGNIHSGFSWIKPTCFPSFTKTEAWYSCSQQGLTLFLHCRDTYLFNKSSQCQ